MIVEEQLQHGCTHEKINCFAVQHQTFKNYYFNLGCSDQEHEAKSTLNYSYNHVQQHTDNSHINGPCRQYTKHRRHVIQFNKRAQS